MTKSSDIISTLLAHGMILGGNTAKATTSGNSSNTVLAARSTKGCKNPQCKAKKRMTHTTDDCYWPGGGKEGQFPPNFGQRAKANVTTSTSASTTVPPTPNTSTQTPAQNEHFVLAARDLITPGRSGVLIDDLTDLPPKALITKGFKIFQKGKTLTFMDSGASDTMFISKDLFVGYQPVSQIGESAKATGRDFEIIGEGDVTQRYLVDGGEQTITYTRALHAPTLNANLVSVSAFDRAGLLTTFGGGKGVVKKPDETIILTGKGVNGMYLLETLDAKSHTPLALHSLSNPMSLEQWHRRLAHCSPLTIKDMANNGLVDGLTISEDTVTGKCKDCIMGRQARRPFDGETDKKLEPLELVLFDLWGPSRTQSAVMRMEFSYTWKTTIFTFLCILALSTAYL